MSKLFARAAVFLAPDAGAYLTSLSIPVDGGYTAL